MGKCFFLVPAHPGSPGQRALKQQYCSIVAVIRAYRILLKLNDDPLSSIIIRWYNGIIILRKPPVHRLNEYEQSV